MYPANKQTNTQSEHLFSAAFLRTIRFWTVLAEKYIVPILRLECIMMGVTLRVYGTWGTLWYVNVANFLH